MLEEFDDLISRLCANSPITQEEHRDRLFFTDDGLIFDSLWESNGYFKFGRGLVWFCGPGVLRVVGCYWWCCAHWRAYWLGESQSSALWGCSSL